jgi:hypothetical protein
MEKNLKKGASDLAFQSSGSQNNMGLGAAQRYDMTWLQVHFTNN